MGGWREIQLFFFGPLIVCAVIIGYQINTFVPWKWSCQAVTALNQLWYQQNIQRTLHTWLCASLSGGWICCLPHTIFAALISPYLPDVTVWLVLFLTHVRVCMCVVVSSWQNVVLETPTVAGPTTEVSTLSTLAGIYLSQPVDRLWLHYNCAWYSQKTVQVCS